MPKKIDMARGLTEAEVEVSRKKHGKNQLTKQTKSGFWRRFFANLNDPIIRILLGALLISALTLFGDGSLSEVFGIAAAVLISTFVSTLSEYRSEKAFATLQAQSANYLCRVLRDGRLVSLPLGEVVVGDIVLLQAGEQVPADGFVVEGEVGVDLSGLNGESKEQVRRPYDADTLALSAPNALLRGSSVLSGNAKMRIVKVGDATVYGSLAKELQQESVESPLKTKLSHLAKVISRVGYLSAVLVVIADLVYSFLICQAAITPSYIAQNLLHALMLGITVIVVAVPEGLPMMITVVLSSNIFRMTKNQVFVRKGIGIETAGGIQILFCDKTGTLTCGKMQLSSFLFADGKEYRSMRALPASWQNVIALSGWQNTDSDVAGKEIIGGNATDRLLLQEVLPYRAMADGYTRIAHHPFSSTDKYSYATVQKGKTPQTLVKGAPELIFPRCTHALSKEGERVPFTEQRSCRAKWQKMTQSGMRVLCLATTEATQNVMQSDMTFVCFLCISDTVRPEAKHAVSKLQGAGVQTVMMTGDNEKTARSIAHQCGILQNASPQAVLCADELHQMDDQTLARLLPHLRVICRALPSDKSRLVKIAQAQHLVVGMTGDGLNDAPALKSADVGFAMGAGSDVAKEASDIVILDNNIASIVRAVLYGRTIFQSIRKFILFQLTMNFCAVIVSMIAPFVGADTPITVMQMLWINLIMDTLAGLAFAGENPDIATLNQPPLRRHTPVLTRNMVIRIAGMGVYCVMLCIGFLKSPRVLAWFDYNPIAHLTGFFTLFVFCGVFCAFHARTRHPNVGARLWQNHAFLWIMTAVCGVQIVMVYFGGSAMRCTPLSLSQLLNTILLAATVLPYEAVRKTLFYFLLQKKPKRISAQEKRISL